MKMLSRVLAPVLVAGCAVLALQAPAQAATELVGIYPNFNTCNLAGNAGQIAKRWDSYWCDQVGGTRKYGLIADVN